MSEPSNTDICNKIVEVKGQLGRVDANVNRIRQEMLSRADFDAKIEQLSGKESSAEKKDDEDWKTRITNWSDGLLGGVGKVVENLLAGKWEALTLAVLALFGVQFVSWTSLLKKAMDKRGYEEKSDGFLKYGKKPTAPQPQGPIRSADIQNLKDARRVATALARSLTNLSQEMERVVQAAA
ncbi:hypothetical protein [Streptomyces sp. NPDC001508]|uniref:hypothetical protein n=1 Tax=Streptomyces sp. NPDC001508 TaxID=3154656 RepID=UPI00332CCAD2